MDEPARADRLHPDLGSNHGCVLYGSLLVFGVPGLFFLGSAGWLVLTPPTTKDPLAPAMASAVFATPMRIHAFRNERGGLFLELHSLADSRMREPQIRMLVETPAWDTGDLDGQIAKVRIDEDPQGPVVVETARGLLWMSRMTHRQNQVEGRLG